MRSADCSSPACLHWMRTGPAFCPAPCLPFPALSCPSWMPLEALPQECMWDIVSVALLACLAEGRFTSLCPACLPCPACLLLGELAALPVRHGSSKHSKNSTDVSESFSQSALNTSLRQNALAQPLVIITSGVTALGNAAAIESLQHSRLQNPSNEVESSARGRQGT